MDSADTLDGHLVVALRGSLQAPVQLGSRTDWANRAAAAPGVGVDLSFGISRHVALGVRASHAWLGDSSDHLEGGGLTGGGLLLRYHLSQGVRFDPWLAASLGLLSRAPSTGPSLILAEAIRFEMGGDWYATRGVGFGPVLAGALMAPLSGAVGEPRQLAGLAEFSVRLVVDRPGK
ncbi:MAG: hypothetical protein FJ104_14945 [Deltaproteobacteria bacterium]|nr:hypothetical protein [Deltaproteobacteria bacterium]